MSRSIKIPTLKNGAFHQTYFRHPVAPSNPLVISDDLYFEIDRRCIWKNSIPSHRLDFYMVFIVTEGEGIHTFGSQEYYIKKNMLSFVGPEMVSAWESDMDSHQGFFCGFSESFAIQGQTNKLILQELPFFQLGGVPLLQLTDEQTQYYLTLFRMMHSEHQNRNGHSSDVLRGLLQTILYKSLAQYKMEDCHCNEANRNGLRLLKAFKALYLRDFKTLSKNRGLALKNISDYADELGVSQNHLNDTIKLITGRSAGQLIKHQLVSHATSCLMHADKSISEIAYALGFEDPSYFARFYKNQTGKSPSELRETGHL